MNALDYSFYSSLMTVVMLVVFFGIVLWAYSAERRTAFDAAARMPLDDDMQMGGRGEPAQPYKDMK